MLKPTKKLHTDNQLANPDFDEAGFTTTSEGENESLLSFFPSAVGANPAMAGFTVMETVVAIAILLIVVTGIMNVIYQGVTSANYQQERITATYLATDAIEFLRYSRDSFWLEDFNDNTFFEWVSGDGEHNIPDCIGSPCSIDTRPNNSGTVIEDCGEACNPMQYHTNRGYYGHETGGAWRESRFTRSVVVDPNGNEEAEITATVSWTRSDGNDVEVIIRESLFDYIDQN